MLGRFSDILCHKGAFAFGDRLCSLRKCIKMALDGYTIGHSI